MENKEGRKILKGILIVLVIAIVLFLMHTVRNYIIISKMSEKASKYIDSTNYHVKSISKQVDNNASLTIDSYKKDEKQVVFLERKNNNQETVKMSVYNNGQRTDMFIENGTDKTAKLDISSDAISVELVNFFEAENTKQRIAMSIVSHIRTTKYNDQKCYLVKNPISTNMLFLDGKNIVYIDKYTGLMVKNQSGENEVERTYEFDCITDDSIFIEPNIGEYTLK